MNQELIDSEMPLVLPSPFLSVSQRKTNTASNLGCNASQIILWNTGTGPASPALQFLLYFPYDLTDSSISLASRCIVWAVISITL